MQGVVCPQLHVHVDSPVLLYRLFHKQRPREVHGVVELMLILCWVVQGVGQVSQRPVWPSFQYFCRSHLASPYMPHLLQRRSEEFFLSVRVNVYVNRVWLISFERADIVGCWTLQHSNSSMLLSLLFNYLLCLESVPVICTAAVNELKNGVDQ